MPRTKVKREDWIARNRFVERFFGNGDDNNNNNNKTSTSEPLVRKEDVIQAIRYQLVTWSELQLHQWKNDRDVVMACIKTKTNQIRWTDIPFELQQHLDILLLAIQWRCLTWGHINTTLNTTTTTTCMEGSNNNNNKWKGDPDVTRAFANEIILDIKQHKIKAFVKVMIRAMESSESEQIKDWADVPPELQHRDVLLMAIRRRRVVWCNIESKWKSDRDVVIACIGLRQIEHWAEVSPQLQNEKEVAFVAYQTGLVAASEVPSLMRDLDFFRKAFEQGKLQWRGLPDNMRTSEAFARTVTEFPRYCSKSMFEDIPNLLQDRDIWATVFDSHGVLGLDDIIPNMAPDTIRADRELILKAGASNMRVLQFADRALQIDHTFLESVFDAYPRALVHMTHEAQRLFPSLLIQRLKPFAQHPDTGQFEISKLAEAILPELWQQRGGFVQSWFQSGLPYIVDVHPNAWKNDKGIFLLIAEHCDDELGLCDSFEEASLSVLADKDCMLEIVRFEPELISKASSSLRMNFDFMLLAVSGGNGMAIIRLYWTRGYKKGDLGLLDRDDFQQRIQKMLALYDAFVKEILGAMSSVGKADCALSTLNQGLETSAAYKKLIAEYLDVPAGHMPGSFLRASNNLK
ncbi:hypothetical protein FRACYDRAFT_250505 [Fragilariopsis cylindrus CCMP1102]|uniref:Uncharacterized protein n=1 Tax=Fragilariopsis cylindrus CCMP1102 TaxID=635003 RepID=A0A1E7EPH1_9STRA|nr:hypothetical protein FRACYDRAFT_250505 [Fragilariopsis cylindrus CCMP1102]|eukprot:OEU07880.1 hypothetical protein FRACYDRAFT_250505 [Fragilariopsis cylindrus CCMP1102]